MIHGNSEREGSEMNHGKQRRDVSEVKSEESEESEEGVREVKVHENAKKVKCKKEIWINQENDTMNKTWTIKSSKYNSFRTSAEHSAEHS